MKKITKEEFWGLYEMLPESLQNQLFSPKSAAAIQRTLEKHNLIGDKGQHIPELVGSILLGVTPEDNLVKELKALGFNKQKAEAVGDDIYNAILKPVRIDLEKIQRNRTKRKRLKETPKLEKKENDKYSEKL